MKKTMVVLGVLAGCGGSAKDEPPGEVYQPDVGAAEFVAGVDNPYFPLPVGATWALEVETDEGLERIEVSVTAETRTIQDVEAIVVRDTVTLAGALFEDTYDWYAQDSVGNVWYLGEETCEYENDVCVNALGSWEWGQDGALPGIIMPADPAVDGRPYYQEYFVGHAEDAGEVVEVGVSVSVAAGDFDDCVRTHDFSTLDPELDEHKTFCPGVGNVLVEEHQDGEPDVREELVSYEMP